jgi:hypothetical protein
MRGSAAYFRIDDGRHAMAKAIERRFNDSHKPIRLHPGLSVPHAIGDCFGETLSRSAGFQWMVEESVSSPGKRFAGPKQGRKPKRRPSLPAATWQFIQ